MESRSIAIMGNTGKTIFSFFLGQLLSSTKKRVVLVSTDGDCPVYDTLFPQKRKREGGLKSLGKLLSLPVITQGDIFQHGHIVNDNFCMLTYDEHESSLNYPVIGEAAMRSFVAGLEKMADIVIFDTATSKNKIDQYIETLAILKIVISSADAKGFYYRDLHPQGRWNLYLQTSKYNALQDMQDSFQGEAHKAILLPYSQSLQSVYNGLDITDVIPNAAYRKVLLQIAGEL